MDIIATVLIGIAALNILVLFFLGAGVFIDLMADQDEAEFFATPRPDRRDQRSAASRGREARR